MFTAVSIQQKVGKLGKMLKLAVSLFLLLMSLLMFGYVNKVNAAETIVKVEAPPQVNPDTNFNVSIIAENIPNQNGGMAGWQLVLTWNASKLNCTNEFLNLAFWPQNSGPLVANPIDNENGKYRQALALRAPSQPVTGTYWLVNLTFHSTSDITEPITVILQILPDVENGLTYCLIDKTGEEIPHEFGTSQLPIISEFPSMILLITFLAISAASILITKHRKNPP
jgi:hypothetical protein